jgi:galactokinase
MSDANPRVRAVAAYRRHFGREPEMLFRAPGRVNLIGEHTDYNDGFVLPCAIDRETVVAIGRADNARITAVAADFGDHSDAFTLGEPITRVKAEWINYVRGVARALIEDGFALSSAQMAIAGDVPLGSGLSSSASLEVAVGTALVGIAGATIDPTQMAKIAQRAENEFVGCACGIMDQLISAQGEAGHALLIDCRLLECTPVPIPDGVSIIVAHSGVRHAHAGGEYNDRRAQCKIAARHYSVAALRDLTRDQLEARKAGLDDISYRRARHVVSENDRTQAAASALKRGDLKQLGVLMAQSHQSMRDDFAVTVPAVDRLADIMAAPLRGEGGARMTGGGFGGCVIAAAPITLVPAVVKAIADRYRTPEGLPAEVFVCQPSAGASALEIPPNR